jgi:hypothetical protein
MNIVCAMASTRYELITWLNISYDIISLATENVIGDHRRMAEQEREPG